MVVAGKDYGAGSSRDWAAKGPKLLGVRAILAESFERIHRSNLIGMGILPLQFLPGQSAQSLGLTGEETITVGGLASAVADPTRRQVEVRADGTTFSARVRLDTRREADYYATAACCPMSSAPSSTLDADCHRPERRIPGHPFRLRGTTRWRAGRGRRG